jgi:cytochrome c5
MVRWHKEVRRKAMAWTRMSATVLVLTGLGFLPAACDQQASGGHMMAGGMMGGGMMGNMPSGNTSQTLPEQQSEGAQLLKQFCSECHAPPAPSAHTAREWPQVVDRMNQHMVTQGKPAPDREQLRKLIAYLQKNAG